MSLVSKFLAALLLLASVTACFGEDPVSITTCSGDVCSFIVFAENLISTPCQGYSVLVAYSKLSGATLIQCSKPESWESDISFIFDRYDPKLGPFELFGERFFSGEAFDQFRRIGIQDKSELVPLCPARKRERPANGQILIGKGEECYQLSYVTGGKSTLAVYNDNGKELAPASEQVAAKWATLVATLKPYMHEEPQSTVQGSVATVAVEKALLFLGPYENSGSKMYLVKGDKVQIVRYGGDDNWCYIRYQTHNGKTIERWVRVRDLQVAGK